MCLNFCRCEMARRLLSDNRMGTHTTKVRLNQFHLEAVEEGLRRVAIQIGLNPVVHRPSTAGWLICVYMASLKPGKSCTSDTYC